MRQILLAVSAVVVVGCGSVVSNNDAATGSGSDGSNGPTCGDGTVNGTEECDDGTANNGAGKACNAMCKHNVCGDGDKGPAEMCDNGAANGENLGDCAPDCSKLVAAKHIVISANASAGMLGANPVATADGMCPAGHKAMFAFGTVRRATTAANDTVDPVDWPIQTYTQYINSTGQVIWKTGTVRLLGVTSGAFTALMNPITATTGIGCYTGLAQNWTTLTTNDCNGWQALAASHNSGIANLTSIGVINNGGTAPCDTTAKFYCVEQ